VRLLQNEYLRALIDCSVFDHSRNNACIRRIIPVRYQCIILEVREVHPKSEQQQIPRIPMIA